MMTLSVVLATYNEEKNIAKCLDSVKDIADEIVVVDGTSRDKTVEIAKKYNAKVIIRPNPKVFHINKQIAIDNAKKDWILQLDADEKVSKSLAKEITDVLKEPKTKNQEPRTKNHERTNGYWIPRKNYFLGRFLKKGGQYPDYTLRLYRNGKGKLPQKDVHEQAVVEGEVGYLKNALLHYPYKNFTHYIKKWWTYVGIESMLMENNRKKRNVFVNISEGFYLLFLAAPYWFIWTYIRHKGFVDKWQGLVFSFFSSVRIPVAYIRSLI